MVIISQHKQNYNSILQICEFFTKAVYKQCPRIPFLHLKDCRIEQFFYLCFDGIAYYSRVWLNGVLLGEHEGMFGGPVCDVAAHLIAGGENELIVEIKACNYGVKEKFNS
jgi:beta-galactosidase/beta-glucuronidase